MTGFARAEGAHEASDWTWEVKSVNGRGLDFRCRAPHGFDALERVARTQAQERFRRGNITATLTLVRKREAGALSLNRDLVERILALVGDLGDAVRPPTADGLLSMPGVLVAEEISETDQAARDTAIAASLSTALDGLVESRQAEGARLALLVAALVDQIEAGTGAARACAATQPGALKERLRKQIDALLEASPPLAEERLVQEAALLAAKADIREELDRLEAHVALARDLLKEGQAIGRRLDFLCQEFNREANTLCSKSTDVALTRIGLDLKTCIDQLREQVQNIE